MSSRKERKKYTWRIPKLKGMDHRTFPKFHGGSTKMGKKERRWLDWIETDYMLSIRGSNGSQASPIYGVIGGEVYSGQ